MLPIILGIAAAVCLVGCAASTEQNPAKSPEKKSAKKGPDEVDQSAIEEPKPPEVDKEDEALKAQCPQLSRALGANDFFVSTLSTVDPHKGYDAAIVIDKLDNKYPIYLGPFKKLENNNNYPFQEGQENHSLGVEGLPDTCNSWKLDKAANQRVGGKVDDFIREHMTRFQSLRDQAKLVRVADVPYNNPNLNWLVMALDRPKILENISKTKLYETHSKRKLNRSIYAFKQYFSDVGLEYVTDPASTLTYTAIYHHVDDKKNGKPPVLFVVDQKRVRGSNIEPMLFVHNFNEDNGSHYMDAKGVSKASTGIALSSEALHERCDKEMGNQSKIKACKSMVDLCMAAGNASAKITLNTDAGPVTLDNSEQCVDAALFLSSMNFWLVE